MVDVVVGGLALARAFTRVRWDHLLYTGSPTVGREIAKAAAEQLVPVTLELGGKCPAILTEDSVDAESVKQLLATKAIKNGQMCISVDYCLVPRERVEDFAGLMADHVRDSMPGYCESDSCTGMISSRHLDRIQGLLEDARARGCDAPCAGAGTTNDSGFLPSVSMTRPSGLNSMTMSDPSSTAQMLSCGSTRTVWANVNAYKPCPSSRTYFPF